MSVRTSVARRGESRFNPNALIAIGPAVAPYAAVAERVSTNSNANAAVIEGTRHATSQDRSTPKTAAEIQPTSGGFVANLLVRGVLVEPVPFVHHLERSEGLLRLVVVVQLPWQIGDANRSAMSAATVQNVLLRSSNDPPLLASLVTARYSRQRMARTGEPSPPSIFSGSATKL
jgi:hypothetical protein